MAAPARAGLRGRVSVGARITRRRPGCRRLAIPGGDAGRYRLAQLDDYGGVARAAFPWESPVRLQLAARVSSREVPGTWGFGWWNDPFSAHLAIRGGDRRLPALPNAAWFFHASPENYLAVRDDHPADGMLAATFAAPRVPSLLLALGLPATPLALWPPTARVVRLLARTVIDEDAARLDIDPTEWHSYAVTWESDGVSFAVDGGVCFTTNVAPLGPLGLVIWIDNQYAAFRPDGDLSFGTLANDAAWLDIADVVVQQADGAT